MDSPGVGIGTLGFFTVWLTLWSLGVGFLSASLLSWDGSLGLFLITHGGAEVVVAWMTAGLFAQAAERTVTSPALTLDLAGMTARWRGTAWTALLLAWCAGLGLFIGVVLGAGTWMPVVEDATPARLVVASLLSVAWGVIGWRWWLALRRILDIARPTTLSATLDRVTVTRHLAGGDQARELPAQHLQARAHDDRLLLSVGHQQELSLTCGAGPERDRLVRTLNEMALRAAASPAQQPEPPPALAALRARSARD